METLFKRESVGVETERLWLRQWRPSDAEAFAAINADPVVMKYFPAPMTREESDALMERCSAMIATYGWGLWAVERKDTSALIGLVGLLPPRPNFPFFEGVEVGWRLGKEHWRQGFALEAAKASMRVGFLEVGLSEIFSMTALVNLPSRRLMERLGLSDLGQDFEHPSVPKGSPLRMHCVYRSSREEWKAHSGR